MTLTLKNARAPLTTTVTDVYTCPAGTKAIVLSVVAPNISAAESTVTIQWVDASAGTTTRLVYQAACPKGNAIDIPRFVLEAGDKLQALCGTAGAFEITASMLEVS